MFAIRKSKTHRGKCVPNVLPCRINHTGPVDASRRYWSPRKLRDETLVSYFRGRKLHGKRMKLPKGYNGLVLSSTEQCLPKEPIRPAEDRGEEDEDEVVEVDAVDVKVLEEDAGFDEIVVWGHEALPDDLDDPYVRGIQEWTAFAEQIHSTSSGGKKKHG